MVTRADQCHRREGQLQKGSGIGRIKDLADVRQMYGHNRLFSHIVLDPGCGIGYHTHTGETEFYYMLRGDAVFSDNGKETVLHAGDVSATGNGEGHSLENRGTEPVELIALITLE